MTCLPNSYEDQSLIDLARELALMAPPKRDPKACVICTKDYVCYWHRDNWNKADNGFEVTR